MHKEELMEKYDAKMKYFVVEMIKKCWDNDGEPVEVSSNFPLDYIQSNRIGGTEKEQLLLKECFLQTLEQDEHITYDSENNVVKLSEFIG